MDTAEIDRDFFTTTTLSGNDRTGMKHEGAFRSKRTLVCVAFGVLAVLMATGCGKTPQQDPSSATTATLAGSSTTTLSPDDVAILQGYSDFQAAFLAAADPMNPSDPRLSQHSTGKELGLIQSSFLARKSAGQVIRGTIDLAPHVTSHNGNDATVTDCTFDHSRHYDVNTGQPIDPADTSRQLIEVTMQFEGSWKVANIDHKGSGCSPAS